MQCNICPLYHYVNNENGTGESCDIFGDGWDSRFQYERNKQVWGCYIEKAYIRKIEKEMNKDCKHMPKEAETLEKQASGMSKAIFAMDMPERCTACKFLRKTDEGYCYCGLMDFDYQVNEYVTSVLNGKPDWCPLKPVPEKKEWWFRTYVEPVKESYRRGEADGWNACIDKILKEGDANGNK